MEHLYAPWRMEYIRAEPDAGCLFCRVLAAPAAEDGANLVVWRGESSFAMLNKYPYNSGHLMVAPAAHAASLTDLDDRQLLDLMSGVRRVLRVLGGELRPEGFNAGINLGKAAGAGIPGHVHVHVVPRWNGDTNFMPVVGEVKIVNEHLAHTYERLRVAFSAAAG